MRIKKTDWCVWLPYMNKNWNHNYWKAIGRFLHFNIQDYHHTRLHQKLKIIEQNFVFSLKIHEWWPTAVSIKKLSFCQNSTTKGYMIKLTLHANLHVQLLFANLIMTGINNVVVVTGSNSIEKLSLSRVTFDTE